MLSYISSSSLSFSVLRPQIRFPCIFRTNRWMTHLLQTFSSFASLQFPSSAFVYSILPPYLPPIRPWVLSKPGDAPPLFLFSTTPCPTTTNSTLTALSKCLPPFPVYCLVAYTSHSPGFSACHFTHTPYHFCLVPSLPLVSTFW